MNVLESVKNKNWQKTFLTVFVFALVLSLIYLLFPTKDYYWDGIIYSKFIEQSSGFGIHLLHPNHLFYNGLGYLAFHASRSFRLADRAIYVLQFLTIICSVLSAVFFFYIVKSLTRSNYLSLTITALLAFSAAWWRLSTDADVYLISVLFLLAAFYFLLPNQTPRPVLVALLHSSAMFFHELAVLFFPAAVLGIYFQTIRFERRKQIICVLKYSIPAFLLTFGTFSLSFYFLNNSFDARGFYRWLTSFAPVPGFMFDARESIRLTLRGNRQLFVDGSSRLFIRNLITVPALIIFTLTSGILLFQIGRNRREFKALKNAIQKNKFFRQPIVLLCVVWIIPYLVFLFFFIPENTFYRLFYFPPVILLFGIILAPLENTERRRQWRLASLAIALCLYNFLFYIYPNSQVRENTPLALALAANRIWTDKTTVYYEPVAEYDTLSTNNRLVGYFNPRVVWKPLNFVTLEQFDNDIRATDNGVVWFDELAVERLMQNPETAQWLRDNFNQNEVSELLLPKYKIKYVKISPK